MFKFDCKHYRTHRTLDAVCAILPRKLCCIKFIMLFLRTFEHTRTHMNVPHTHAHART